MDYSISIARPPGYIHSAAFTELAELICHGLTDLGHRATWAVNSIRPGSTPIVIGCHLMDPNLTHRMPRDTIVLNTEQIHGRTGKWNDAVLLWVRRFETWDYSARNIETLSRETSMPLRLLRLGHHPALERIESVEECDIDVLFYGSLNDRRKLLLDRIAANGIAVKSVFGVYGPERDELIARSRIVLNLHYYATQIFEIVRVFYLMINCKAVVAEINADTAIDPVYRNGVAGVPFEDIPGACERLLANALERRALEKRAFDTIARLPQATLLAPLVAR